MSHTFHHILDIRYDTKGQFNVDSKLSDQLNLEHVARKIYN